MSVNTPSKEQRAERHLMRMRGAGKFARAIDSGSFAFTIAAVRHGDCDNGSKFLPSKRQKLDSSTSRQEMLRTPSVIIKKPIRPNSAGLEVERPIDVSSKIAAKERARLVARKLFDDNHDPSPKLCQRRINKSFSSQEAVPMASILQSDNAQARKSSIDQQSEPAPDNLRPQAKGIDVISVTSPTADAPSKSKSRSTTSAKRISTRKVAAAKTARTTPSIKTAPSSKTATTSKTASSSTVSLPKTALISRIASVSKTAPTLTMETNKLESLTQAASTSKTDTNKLEPSTQTTSISTTNTSIRSGLRSRKRSTSKLKIQQIEDNMESLPSYSSESKMKTGSRKPLANISTNSTVSKTTQELDTEKLILETKVSVTNGNRHRRLKGEPTTGTVTEMNVGRHTQDENINSQKPSMTLANMEDILRKALLAQNTTKPAPVRFFRTLTTNDRTIGRKRSLPQLDEEEEDVDLDDLITNITSLTKGDNKASKQNEETKRNKRQKLR